MNVSVGMVNRLKSTYHMKKSLMVSAILIFFTFGAFAMSLAYEPASEGPLYTTASSDHASGDGLLGSDTFPERLAVICLSGDVPRSAQPNFQTYRINYVRVVDPVKIGLFLREPRAQGFPSDSPVSAVDLIFLVNCRLRSI